MDARKARTGPALKKQRLKIRYQVEMQAAGRVRVVGMTVGDLGKKTWVWVWMCCPSTLAPKPPTKGERVTIVVDAIGVTNRGASGGGSYCWMPRHRPPDQWLDAQGKQLSSRVLLWNILMRRFEDDGLQQQGCYAGREMKRDRFPHLAS
jgi:hypothetical protein